MIEYDRRPALGELGATALATAARFAFGEDFTPPPFRPQLADLAGTPGDCMFHCDLIEHPNSGMMGNLRVS